jgi:hypothetical protein
MCALGSTLKSNVIEMFTVNLYISSEMGIFIIVAKIKLSKLNTVEYKQMMDLIL